MKEARIDKNCIKTFKGEFSFHSNNLKNILALVPRVTSEPKNVINEEIPISMALDGDTGKFNNHFNIQALLVIMTCIKNR